MTDPYQRSIWNESSNHISRQSRTKTIPSNLKLSKFGVPMLPGEYFGRLVGGCIPLIGSEVALNKFCGSRLDGVLDSRWRCNKSIVC